MLMQTSVTPPVASPPAEFDDDDSLLTRMKADDADAYRMLVERHVDRAYAIALRMLGNVADAEDVAQECMVRAWTHRNNWQVGRAKFSTWLYRVVVNRCIDLKRVPKGSCLDDVPEPIDDQQADAADGIHRREVFGRLEAAIRALPEQQRVALTLSYFDDLGNGEIAEILGTTVSAVESLLKRGRQGLRERLRRSERDFRQILGGA